MVGRRSSRILSCRWQAMETPEAFAKCLGDDGAEFYACAGRTLDDRIG